MADFIYYWRKYHSDIARGPIYKFNQNSKTMTLISPGDTVWIIARPRTNFYILAAKFIVMAIGENSPSDFDYKEHGRFYFLSDASHTRYFDPKQNTSIEPTIRSLSITTKATLLGTSFQGPAGVRELRPADAHTLERLAARLS